MKRSQEPKPGLNLLGYIPPNYSGLITYLKETQGKLKSDISEAIEKEMELFSMEDRHLIIDIVREEFYPNPYRTVNEDQIINQKEESKDLEQSQDYMDKTARPSLRERFTRTLKYNEAFRNGRDITSPTRQIEPDREH